MTLASSVDAGALPGPCLVDKAARPQLSAPPTPCPDGGIGRRTSFRCWRSQGRGGSSPLLGTISFPLRSILIEKVAYSGFGGIASATTRARSCKLGGGGTRMAHAVIAALPSLA